ncbi:MAG TPA: hypothetical protein VHI99_02365 [Vicinamibacterales bacterium]|jgi:hypothetical protein|nr:hypothetical protein [Vicinamibacterales bacterium]
MWSSRVLWAGLALVLGILQAWDSGAYAAGATVAALATTAILVAALAVAVTTDVRVRGGALAAGFLLLTWARIISPASLNGLHVSLVVPAFCLIAIGIGRTGLSAN